VRHEILSQTANIAKLIRPKRILNAIRSPIDALEKFRYHYRRVSQRNFVDFLANKWGRVSKDVDEAYKDLDRHKNLWKDIENKLSIYPGGYGLQMTRELPVLYLITRLIRPSCIVETGVSAGASSTYILCALDDNKYGKLHSIDLPPDNLPSGKSSGWVVPDCLKERWRIHVGDSEDILYPLLNDIGEIDFFIHDSLHTYEHMLSEFRTAWKHLCPRGLFMTHDVGANLAFLDFMKEQGISWKNYRVFHVLGGFQKPEMSKTL
jgi:hypothetical protein